MHLISRPLIPGRIAISCVLLQRIFRAPQVVGEAAVQGLQVAAHREDINIRAPKGLAAQMEAIWVTVAAINSRAIRLVIRATLSN